MLSVSDNQENMFQSITDPETNEIVSLDSEIGQQVIKNYLIALEGGADSPDIVSTQKFYKNNLEKSSTKNPKEYNIELAAKKLSDQQFTLEELFNNSFSKKKESNWTLKENKIVWIKRSSGKWQLGIIGSINDEDLLDVYFNSGDDEKLGLKKGLKKKRCITNYK